MTLISQKKLAVNSISMLANRLTQGIATFIITATIARTLGAEVVGQYLLATSYYYIFVNLASQGFKTLFTRELARDPSITPVYVISGTLLQFVFGLVAYIAMVGLVYVLPYNNTTSFICYVTGMMIIPFSLSNITEAIFQAQEKMHLIAISTVPIYILRLLAIIWVVPLPNGIIYVVSILIASESIILVIQWLLLARIVKPKWQIDWDFIWKTINISRTFFAMEGIGFIASKVDMLILSLLGSELLVGIYGGICQLLQPYYIVSNSVAVAAFPAMTRSVAEGKDKQRQVAESVIEILLCISLPFLVGMIFTGDRLLMLIYQDPSFAQSANILHIISLSLITGAFSRIFSYLLIANGLEELNLIEVVVTTIVGSLTGIIFIYHYQLTGAAFMSLSIGFTNFGVLAYFVSNRLFTLRILQIIYRPLLISFLMAMVFLLLDKNNINIWTTIALSTLSYAIFTSAILLPKLKKLSL